MELIIWRINKIKELYIITSDTGGAGISPFTTIFCNRFGV
jgi:hypothetical protein